MSFVTCFHRVEASERAPGFRGANADLRFPKEDTEKLVAVRPCSTTFSIAFSVVV